MFGRMGMPGRMMGPMMDPRSRLFMALASDQRLRLLDLIRKGEKSSVQLTQELGLDPSVVSRHLTLLRGVGLVTARREGVALFFTIPDARILQLVSLATEIIQDWLDQNRQFFRM